MIKYYSVPKQTFITNGTIVEPLTATENGTYAPPAGTAYSPVIVNVEGGGSGGGGSSDFSTAVVTYPNGISNALPLAMIVDDEILLPAGAIPAGTYTFVLYKEKMFLHNFPADYLNQNGYSTSGNIIYDSEGAQYVITGDFTLTEAQS